VIVAGANFGCGSSREHAPIAIKAAGCCCVIAKSFARIFYRNAINTGLAIFESTEAVDGISPGDRVEADVAAGEIRNLTTGKTFRSLPFPEGMRDIIDAGGLMAYVKRNA
jgi:3-isopropylmalate/(R)-2-methylmalate dehydratase small subunit